MSEEMMTNDVAMETEAEAIDLNTVYAKVIKDDEGFKVVDFDGTVGPVCKLSADGKWIALTKNKANRQWISVSKADIEIAEKGQVDLFYKPTKHIGPTGNRLPNERLISYLSEEDQAEYKAIIDRARAAKEADKAKPKTELEKAQEKVERARKAYEKLLAEAAVENN